MRDRSESIERYRFAAKNEGLGFLVVMEAAEETVAEVSLGSRTCEVALPWYSDLFGQDRHLMRTARRALERVVAGSEVVPRVTVTRHRCPVTVDGRTVGHMEVDTITASNDGYAWLRNIQEGTSFDEAWLDERRVLYRRKLVAKRSKDPEAIKAAEAALEQHGRRGRRA